MTILAMNRKELEKKVGKVDEKLEKTITDMGTPIEYVNDDEVAIEIFPNRPDLMSLQNFARALQQYRGKAKASAVKIHEPEKDYEVVIDKSIKGIRNHTACCIVKGLKFTDETIKEVIDLQEKLHNSLGRKRKKAAIGVYPLEKISLPITFKADDPQNVSFKPLEFPKEITAKQILSKHPTGREYGHLLEGFDKYPFFIDAKGSVLSMPPIINSEETGRITEETTDIFIECSGDNLYYLQKVLNIMVMTFSEMGGKIHAMNIVDKKDKSFVSPNLAPEELAFTISDINKTLGLELTEKEIKHYLLKMGIETTKKGDNLVALIPAHRTDILHWIDLTEEVGIAYGYDTFDPIIPDISTIGEEDVVSRVKKVIGNALSGVGLLEVSSFHLTTKKHIKKVYHDTLIEDFIEVEDSKTERDTLRHDMLTNLMQIFSENSDSGYPQKVFEIGRVFHRDESSETKIKETERIGVALIDEQISFTDVKQILDYLTKMMGKSYTLEEYDEHPAFIKGRSGKVLIDGVVVGYIGEVSPRVLKNWKIKAPAAAFELDLSTFL